MSLEPENIDKLRHLLQSAGWREVMKPQLMRRVNDQIKALRLNEVSRQEAGGTFKNKSDTELREGIELVEWWIVAFENEVKVANFNRANDELDRANGELTANP